jgi:hypothetical protein
MKTRIIAVLFLTFLSSPTFAEDVSEEHKLVEAVQEAVDLNKNVAEAGVLPPSCAHCPDKEAHQKINADKKVIDIGNPYYLKSNEPYVVRLVRTSQTPKKLKLKFKNGQKVCRKFIAEPNPWAKGNWIMGCWIQGTDYIDNDIEIDFSELTPLKDNESEIVEIKFTKSSPDKYKYSISAEILKDQAPKGKVSSYFFGDGYDVKFSKEGTSP